jgi:hypothetical protein
MRPHFQLRWSSPILAFKPVEQEPGVGLVRPFRQVGVEGFVPGQALPNAATGGETAQSTTQGGDEEHDEGAIAAPGAPDADPICPAVEVTCLQHRGFIV